MDPSCALKYVKDKTSSQDPNRETNVSTLMRFTQVLGHNTSFLLLAAFVSNRLYKTESNHLAPSLPPSSHSRTARISRRLCSCKQDLPTLVSRMSSVSRASSYCAISTAYCRRRLGLLLPCLLPLLQGMAYVENISEELYNTLEN